MNTEKDLPIPVTAITDVAMAKDMALSELPYHDARVAAAEAGSPMPSELEIATHALAASAATTAGEAYLERKQQEIETAFEAKVAATKKALIERYSSPERKLGEDDFDIVEYQDEAGATKQSLMFTAARALDLGDPSERHDTRRSYNSVMADGSHNITIQGQEVDTRTGVTEALYRAFIKKAQDSEVEPMPDSGDLDVWTLTLLSGEPLDDTIAHFGYVHSDQAYVRLEGRDYGYHRIGFRPAVDLAEIA